MGGLCNIMLAIGVNSDRQLARIYTEVSVIWRLL
jgi:hypothetical protein